MMKKGIIISILLCMSIGLKGQTKQQAIMALKEDVAVSNKSLPMKTSFFTMQKIEIKNSDFIFYLVIDENQTDLDKYVDGMKQYKSNMFSLVAGNRRDFAKLIVTSGLNMIMNVTGNISRRTRQIYLSSAEIAKAFGNNYTSKDYIRELVNYESKSLPEDWGDGLTCTGVKIEGEYICYRIKTDETILTMALLKSIKAEGNEMENNIIEELNNTNDVREIYLFKNLKQSNMGLKYIYWSEKTTGTVVFTITPNTIKTKVKDRTIN